MSTPTLDEMTSEWQRKGATFDQRKDAFEPRKRLGPIRKKGARLIDCSRKKLERCLRAVLPVTHAPSVVPLDVAESLAEIVRVRTVVVGAILESQVLASVLEEVRELLNLDEGEPVVVVRGNVAPHQRKDGSARWRHRRL